MHDENVLATVDETLSIAGLDLRHRAGVDDASLESNTGASMMTVRAEVAVLPAVSVAT